MFDHEEIYLLQRALIEAYRLTKRRVIFLEGELQDGEECAVLESNKKDMNNYIKLKEKLDKMLIESYEQI